MPGAARQTDGIALTQCSAVATMPGLRSRPAAIDSGWRPWKLTLHRRIAGDLHLEALALRAEAPGGIEICLAHQPVHARGDHRLDRAPFPAR